MNWNEINQTAPKAFDTWWEHDRGFNDQFGKERFLEVHQEGWLDLDDWQITLRDLYDFFDSHGINCSVRNYPDGGGLNKWDWSITMPTNNFRHIHACYDSLVGDVPYPEGYDWFETRQLVEEYVFIRAFELLEQQLTA